VRRIICFTHATLDGYIDNPHEWSFQYAGEELQEYALEMTLAADALLLGRITYEGMAQAWPTRGGNPFADHVNSITKYVSLPNRSTPRRGIRPWSSPAPTCSTRPAD
jgi:dihydrofolate reductase